MKKLVISSLLSFGIWAHADQKTSIQVSVLIEADMSVKDALAQAMRYCVTYELASEYRHIGFVGGNLSFTDRQRLNGSCVFSNQEIDPSK